MARPTLLLSGFMGTGKSTVAAAVARLAGVPLVDLDARVAERAGKPVPEIFADRGEAAFRELESAALDEILAEGAPRVVALGGGALLNGPRRRAALSRARVITLRARVETILLRTAGGGRPLLDGPDGPEARVRALLAERAGAYAECHGSVATDDRAPEEVADEVLRLWDDGAIAVPLGTRSYAVRVARDPIASAAELASGLSPSSVFVVTDTTVQRLASAELTASLERRGLRVQTVAVAPGEGSKRLSTLEEVLAAMVGGGADRDALVIGLGGGVITDLAGFAAATLLRGVRWIAVPTTLLAMVDASVGGKTGVDLGPAKNAVGAFHQPSGVVVGPRFVLTETRRAYVSGLAEVVKAAAIGDAALFAELEAGAEAVLARDQPTVERLVLGSIAVKAGIVARDEREAGDRALLNFGHTVGHALEAEGGWERLTHGEAVALGMVAALRVGRGLGVTAIEDAARIEALLGALELPTDLDAQPLRAALPLVGLDKKRRGGSVRVVLLRRIGSALVQPMPVATLAARVADDAARTLPPGARSR